MSSLPWLHPERVALIQKGLAERIMILDGGMGTMLQGHRLDESGYRGERFAGGHDSNHDHGHDHPGECDLKGNNDLLLITQPDIIKGVHRAYLEAGADFVETNTFNATRVSQADYHLEHLVPELNREGARLAREACDEMTRATPDKPRFVIGVLGPTSRTASISPDVNDPGFRNIDFEELKANYIESARALIEGGADTIMVETIFDTLNAKAALFALSELFDQLGARVPVIRRFLDGVRRIHEHLHAGDTFQVNLSRRWCARFAEAPAPAALMHALRRANPAPFAGLLQREGWAIVSSSPERLVESRGGVLQTRPIAGTRPRVPGDDDAARIRELTTHPKERAEHVMLIDLERNDLGRVCVPGSVKVDELMVVESYAHVHHIVSNVRGRARDGITPGQVVAATFPGGTITGCPKVRCMQIIGDIEQEPRGAYTGALGYIDDSGDMDLNILIRTLTAEGCDVSLRAGAGIVTDSLPDKELDETRAKARGLLRIFGAA